MVGAAAMDVRLKDSDVLANPAALIAAIHCFSMPKASTWR